MLHQKRKRARHHAPEGRADSGNDYAAERDQERNQRRFTLFFVLHGGQQGAANGAQQGQAGDGGHQLFGESREHAGDGRAKATDHDIDGPAHHGRGVAAPGLGVNLGAPCKWRR